MIRPLAIYRPSHGYGRWHETLRTIRMARGGHLVTCVVCRTIGNSSHPRTSLCTIYVVRMGRRYKKLEGALWMREKRTQRHRRTTLNEVPGKIQKNLQGGSRRAKSRHLYPKKTRRLTSLGVKWTRIRVFRNHVGHSHD